MAREDRSPCPECGGRSLFTRRVDSGGGYGPNLLPGLGGFLSFAKFDVVLCADCGLTRLFASEEARRHLRDAKGWTRLG